MFEFAICDDDRETCQYIGKTFKKIFAQKGITTAIDLYSSGKEFVNTVDAKKEYDAIFMDISMPEIDGFEVCRKLKTWEKESLVIFISSMENMVFESFKYRPFRFIRKCDFDKECVELITEVMHELLSKRSRLIVVKEPRSGKDFYFSTKNTRYLEAQGRETEVYEKNGEVSVKCRFQDMEEIFSMYGFIRTHRSYMVNYRFIVGIQGGEILFEDGTRLPASRDRIPEIKKQIMLWNKGGIGNERGIKSY